MRQVAAVQMTEQNLHLYLQTPTNMKIAFKATILYEVPIRPAIRVS